MLYPYGSLFLPVFVSFIDINIVYMIELIINFNYKNEEVLSSNFCFLHTFYIIIILLSYDSAFLSPLPPL